MKSGADSHSRFFCFIKSLFTPLCFLVSIHAHAVSDSIKPRLSIHADFSYHLLQNRTPFLFFRSNYSASIGTYIQKNSSSRPGYKYSYNFNLGIFNYSVSAPDLDTSNLPQIGLSYSIADYPDLSRMSYNKLSFNYLFFTAGLNSYIKNTPLYFGFHVSFFHLVASKNVKTYEPVHYSYGSQGVPGGKRTVTEHRAYHFQKNALVPWLCVGGEKQKNRLSVFSEARLNILAFTILWADTDKFPKNGSSTTLAVGPFWYLAGNFTIGVKRHF